VSGSRTQASESSAVGTQPESGCRQQCFAEHPHPGPRSAPTRARADREGSVVLARLQCRRQGRVLTYRPER